MYEVEFIPNQTATVTMIYGTPELYTGSVEKKAITGTQDTKHQQQNDYP